MTRTVMLLKTLPISTVCGVQVMRPLWSMVMTLLLGPVWAGLVRLYVSGSAKGFDGVLSASLACTS